MEPLPKKLAAPIDNEKRPHRPIRWELPDGAFRYKVTDKDDWGKVARENYVASAQYLIFYNFFVAIDPKHPILGRTDEVNWYLRNYVGCNVSKDGGKNWAFSDSADPGIIFIPIRVIEGDAIVIIGSKGVGNIVSVPEYTDDNILDTLSKVLDVYGVVDMGLGILELPALVEGGLIGTGAVSSTIGPLVAIGAPQADILKELSRGFFFEGFSVGFVMSANGASDAYIRNNLWSYPPGSAQYPEKRETFRKLHNYGLEFGLLKGRTLNEVDKTNLFTKIYNEIPFAERQQFSPKIPWRELSVAQRNRYYELASGIVKREMLENKLKLKLK